MISDMFMSVIATHYRKVPSAARCRDAFPCNGVSSSLEAVGKRGKS